MNDPQQDQWLSLGQASALLNVHSSTLRRWADGGLVPHQRTPGGHRRFSRKALLPLLDGNRLAVVVFAGDAYPLLPLTTDLGAAAVFLEGVAPGMVALPGSNLQQAVEAALELLPEEGEGRVLLLFTDGENLQGDVEAATAALVEGGVGLVGVVAGSESGGPIPQHDEGGGVRYKRDAKGHPVVTRAHPEVVAGIAGAAKRV